MSTLSPSSSDLLVASVAAPASIAAPADAHAAPDPLRPPTQEEFQAETARLLGTQLNPGLLQWVDAYAQVGKRNAYLWKWARQGVEATTLSCVDPEWYDRVCDTKVLGVVLDVLLDDIADHGGDPQLLEHLLHLPFGTERLRLASVAAEDRAYAEFTVDVWEEIKRRTREMPGFERMATLWRYDYLQLFNAMRYSHMINQDVALLNLAEHDLYLPHNMHIMISATADLMCSPAFDHSELGRLRDAVWHAQCMGRIGNLVTTWERELGEGDFTSGVYARAIAQGDLCIADLQRKDSETILRAIRQGGHEAFFLQRWVLLRQRLLDLAPRVHSVDLLALLRGYERLIRLHLISRGKK